MKFIINNHEKFQTNSSIHNTSISTSDMHRLHRTNANLFSFQKSKFYFGSKIFSSLPPSMTIFKNDKAKFKAALTKCLYTVQYSTVQYSTVQYMLIYTLLVYVDEFSMCKDDS